MFLKPEDLEKVRMGSLLSLVTNTGLGLVSQPHKPARRYSGTILIKVLLGSVMESLDMCTTITTTATTKSK
jgi:hypothetical protein